MQEWERHAAAPAVLRMPGKSRFEKSKTRAATASSDNSLLVVGCPFLPPKDSCASDFCLQPPKAFARWESLPTPFIVMDEGSTGCSQQEDVNSKARRRTRERGGTAKGPGEAAVWECARRGTTRRSGGGRWGGQEAAGKSCEQDNTARRANVM